MRQKVWLFLFCLTLSFSSFASIIKKPPVKSTEITYKDLACTEDQKTYIYEIISTMAEKGKLSLLFNQTHLKELGDRISDVHPLKFLSVIFSDPYLKSCMMVVWSDYFKRTGFMDGLAPSLTREMEKGKLMSYLKDFAKDVNVSVEHLQGYFDAHDWDNLVLFLIQS